MCVGRRSIVATSQLPQLWLMNLNFHELLKLFPLLTGP